MMHEWILWSPEGREIGRVFARTRREAIRKAPFPFCPFLGEVFAMKVEAEGGKTEESSNR